MLCVSILRLSYYAGVKEGLKANESKNGRATSMKKIWKVFAVQCNHSTKICAPKAAKEAER
jgi:hypothetical protein